MFNFLLVLRLSISSQARRQQENTVACIILTSDFEQRLRKLLIRAKPSLIPGAERFDTALPPKMKGT